MAGRVALGLGGNLGDVRKNMRLCVGKIAEDARFSDLRVSPVYRTSPWGDVEGGDFLNAVVVGKWSATGSELLSFCRGIEKLLSVPVRKNGAARLLDIDVLFLSGAESTEELRLPHPRMAGRRFVLVPLRDVWSSVVPGLGATPDDLLKRVHDSSSVILDGEL